MTESFLEAATTTTPKNIGLSKESFFHQKYIISELISPHLCRCICIFFNHLDIKKRHEKL